MSAGEWRPIEDRAEADPAKALARWGKIRLERGEQEWVLVAEALPDREGNVKQVRVALRRGGGAFLGPGRTYPAVGTIFESVMVTLSHATLTFQTMDPGDRTRVSQAAQQLLERAGRRIDGQR
jgi:hypothetical protein